MIVLFGGTGRVGSATVAALRTLADQQAAQGGVPPAPRFAPPSPGHAEPYPAAHPTPLCRVLTRSPNEARLGLDVEIVPGDLDDKRSVERAMRGAKRVFLLASAHPAMDEREMAVIRAARSGGVEAIVKVSGTDGLVVPDSRSLTMRQHFYAEEELKASGLRWSILRPSAYVQTLMEQIAPFVRDSRRFALPGGDKRFAFVDTRDIGAVAAQILNGEHHWNQAHVLTGPDALSYRDVAEILSEEIGEEVVYRPQSVFFARLAFNQQIHYHHARNEAADLAAILASRFGDNPTDTVAAILNRPARSVRTWIREHRQRFAQ